MNVTGEKGSDAAGEHLDYAMLVKTPYQLTSCNQVLHIQAQSLSNIDDFSTRIDSFFTMSAYYVNRFNKSDPNTLVDSIPMAKITEEPSTIPGSNRCLSFTDGLDLIPLCLNSDEESTNIVESFKKLTACRRGDNLKSLPAYKIKEIFNASCKIYYNIRSWYGC